MVEASHADILVAIEGIKIAGNMRDTRREEQHAENIARSRALEVKIDDAGKRITVLELARATQEGHGAAAKFLIGIGLTIGGAAVTAIAWAVKTFWFGGRG